MIGMFIIIMLMVACLMALFFCLMVLLLAGAPQIEEDEDKN